MTTPSLPRESFGHMIRSARRRLRMTQEDVADEIKKRGGQISQGYVSLIERTAGTENEPDVSWELVTLIAKVLHLDRDASLRATGKDPNSPRYVLRENNDETINARILIEFEIVGPTGERRPLRPEDLTPGMRRELAAVLLNGDLEQVQE